MPQKVDVHEDYKCPICAFPKFGLQNKGFVFCNVHNQPICMGCASMLTELARYETEPMSFFYQRSKRITGLDFHGFKEKMFDSIIGEIHHKLHAPEEEREKHISNQSRHTLQTRHEVVKNWIDIADHYSYMLSELRRRK